MKQNLTKELEMKVHVLIMIDRDMRPRRDIATSLVFFGRDDALVAMENNIMTAIDDGLITEARLERCPESDYVVSNDGRFLWKIEEHILRGECLA